MCTITWNDHTQTDSTTINVGSLAVKVKAGNLLFPPRHVLADSGVTVCPFKNRLL